jgi:hypothetical protein
MKNVVLSYVLSLHGILVCNFHIFKSEMLWILTLQKYMHAVWMQNIWVLFL